MIFKKQSPWPPNVPFNFFSFLIAKLTLSHSSFLPYLALQFCLKATVFSAWCQPDWNAKRFPLHFQRRWGSEVNQGFIRATRVSIHHGSTPDSSKRTAPHLLHGKFLCFSSSTSNSGSVELDVQPQRQEKMRQPWTSESKGAERRARAHWEDAPNLVPKVPPEAVLSCLLVLGGLGAEGWWGDSQAETGQVLAA